MTSLKKLFLIILLTTAFMCADELGEPTWRLSVPTANILPTNTLSIGIAYLDLSITKEVEIGIHGIKYVFNDALLDGHWAIGASLEFGLLPYGVWTKKYDFGELSIGVDPVPYFLFGSFETKIDKDMYFIGEIHNGISAGIRSNVAKNWWVDLGLGLTTYTYTNYLFYNYSSEPFFNYSVPSTLNPYIIASICYSFNIEAKPEKEVKPEVKQEKEVTPDNKQDKELTPEKKPDSGKEKPVDPIK